MSKHYAIKCTNCAAPLDILGGGRVSTVTCSYCHSVLDMNAHYKVLAKFNDAKRPEAPFEIGMRGNIKGVEWQIIGWIHYKTGEFPSEEWDEFFLYSPTHGYAWLVYEKNKLFFSKRVRDFDILSWQERKTKAIFYHKGHYLQKEASYLTYVDYVEGELNWIAKFGDQFTTWDYEGVGFKTLNIEKTADEIEVYHTERLDKADVYRAFELEYIPKKEERKKELVKESAVGHQNTIEDKPNYDGWKVLFLLLLTMILFSFFSSKEISSFYIHQNKTTHNFTIDSNAFLTEIDIVTPSGLKDSKLAIYKDKTKIFYIDTRTVYYMKKFLSHNWSHTSKDSKIYLKLEKGNYHLDFQRSSETQTNIVITIKEKTIRLKYIFPLFVILSILLLYFYRHYFGWKILMVPAIIIVVIVGYSLLDEDFIFGLALFAFYIYDAFSGSGDDDD